MNNKKLGLYYFCADFNEYNGFLDGLFIATQSDVDDLIGKYVYFGECFGKYSECEGTIEKEDIKLVTQDETTIKVLRANFESDTICGYNPICYI